MPREIPEIVRAAAGLAATVLDEARKLPETLPGLPVRVIGLAMQHAMKVQQQYAGLVARGDELFTGIRGEDEPGLATFDDDVEPVVVTPPGFRDSAFDRAAETPASGPAADADEDGLSSDPAADAVLDAAVEELAEHIGEAQTSLDDLADEAPATEEILDELAIDEMVGDAPGAGAPETIATDEGGSPVAAVTESPKGGATQSGSHAPRRAPIDGYDSFSIAQLRGRLRGYALSTVEDLLVYEEATRARAPYLKMLRNRLEKVEEQAVESSPLAPRGV